MGTFNTHIELGTQGYCVCGELDCFVKKQTVGLVRVTRRLPKTTAYEAPVYEEEYMCLETGIMSEQIWTYGKTIFATEEDAKRGAIKRHQENYKQRAIRDEHQAKMKQQERERELAKLKELKEKYESAVTA